MSPRKKSVPEETSAPASSGKKKDGGTSYLIALGVMLVLFAGTVVILLGSPQGKKLLDRAPAATGNENAPTINEPSPNANVNTPEEEPVEEPGPGGLPAGGQVELVNTMEEGGAVIVDQKVVWRTAEGDTTLVEHVRDLLPGLSQYGALFLYARPSASQRVIFTRGCVGDCDVAPANPIAFDPALKAFIPLLNAPERMQLMAAQLSANQNRMWFTGPSEEEEQRELWVYDFVKDTRTSVIRLPAGESMTEFQVELGPAAVHVTWTDPTELEYKVYRGGGTVPSFERPRTEIATRTVSVPQ